MIQNIQWPRYTLKFAYVGNPNKPIDIDFQYSTPAIHPIPEVGDEIQLPKKNVSEVNLDKTVFQVQGRRFLFNAGNAGTGIIYLQIA